MLSLALGQVVFPSHEVAALSPAPRAPRSICPIEVVAPSGGPG